MNGPSANKIIISARTSGTQLEDKGISFLVDSDIEGLTKSDYKTVDGSASDINLENVIVSSSCLIGSLNAGFDILDEAIDRSILAISAEAVGAMEILYKTTVEYTKQENNLVHQLENFKFFNIEWLICLWNMNNVNRSCTWLQ